MGRRVQINGQWVDAPDAPQLPAPAAAPQPQAVATASPRPSVAPGAADLEHAGSVLRDMRGSFGTTPRVAQDAPVSVDQSGISFGGSPLAAATGAVAQGAGQWRSQEDLDLARRRAFLDSKDSMSGIRAVRNLLSEEVTNRGGDATAGGPIPSIRGLEGQLAKLGPAPGISVSDKGAWTVPDSAAGEQATLRAMAFDQPGSSPAASIAGETTADRAARIGFNPATPELAPSGGLPQAAIGNWLQSDHFKSRLRASDTPLDQVAAWQLTPQPVATPKTDPGREARLAAFAATGDAPPTTEGEAVLAAGAGNAYGTRAGQFVPGATMNLGFLDPSELPPLNSQGFYSGVKLGANPGNYRLF